MGAADKIHSASGRAALFLTFGYTHEKFQSSKIHHQVDRVSAEPKPCFTSLCTVIVRPMPLH